MIVEDIYLYYLNASVTCLVVKTKRSGVKDLVMIYEDSSLPDKNK